jgi:hypothetical protein
MKRTLAAIINGTANSTSRCPKWKRKLPRHSPDQVPTSVIASKLNMFGWDTNPMKSIMGKTMIDSPVPTRLRT